MTAKGKGESGGFVGGALGTARPTGHLPERRLLPHLRPGWVKEGAFYFVTICCAERVGNQLCRVGVGDELLKTVEYNQRRRVWHCRLMLLMPDHLHGVFAFPPERGMQHVMTNWKRYLARDLGLEWQRDFFDHRLRNDAELIEKTDYILMNPVRKGLCERVEDWRWVWAPKA